MIIDKSMFITLLEDMGFVPGTGFDRRVYTNISDDGQIWVELECWEPDGDWYLEHHYDATGDTINFADFYNKFKQSNEAAICDRYYNYISFGGFQ